MRKLPASRFTLSPHPSMRGYFAHEIYKTMKKNKKLFVLTGDLGYGMWNRIRDEFPDRFINTGAAEQAMVDIAVGLALEGKIPICYSITTFLLYRPFESIRNYVNHEKLNIKLIASGRFSPHPDYFEDGFTHWAPEDKGIMKILRNIKSVWPKNKEEMPALVKQMIKDKNPWYVNLAKYDSHRK